MNEMDSDYLTNDFFVNANETFGPRFYYSKFMALGSRLMGIQVWFLFLSIVCAFVTAWYTFLTSLKLFESSQSAVLTAVFVLVLPTPILAESTFVVYEGIMTPSALVFPMLIMAFYHFFTRRRIIIPILFVGIASLFQVLYGLTASLLILATYFLSHFYLKKDYFSLKKWLFSCLIMLIFAAASLIPYFSDAVSSAMSTNEFVDIVAYFRNPHHYVPSYFPIQTWIFTICFFLASYFSFRIMKMQNSYHNNYKKITEFIFQTKILTALILFGFLLGYVFVEIIPIKIITTAQTFRYIVLLKWIACIYLSRSIFFAYSRFAALHPISLLINQGINLFDIAIEQPNAKASFFTKLYQRFNENTNSSFNLLVSLGTLLIFSFLIPQREQILIIVAFFVFIVYTLFINEVDNRDYVGTHKTSLFMVVITVGLAVSPFISQRYLPESVDNLLAKVYPKYDFKYKYDDDLNELSQIILAETDKKATFIIPPYLSDIRFSANRAIVVDFKSIPYQDNALLEWRQRIRDCYGETELQGFEAQEDFSTKFQNVKMSQLKAIQTKYNANYAIVEAINPIEENVVFENDSYKLIKL